MMRGFQKFGVNYEFEPWAALLLNKIGSVAFEEVYNEIDEYGCDPATNVSVGYPLLQGMRRPQVSLVVQQVGKEQLAIV